MAGDRDPGPRPLADSLRRIASRVRRVDLVGYAGVESVWPAIPSANASAAVPVRLAGQELTVAVPSGAHAARARRDASAMLDELAAALEHPPTSLRVTVRPTA